MIEDERREEIRALLLLDQLPDVGLVAIRRLVDAAGSAVEALRRPGSLAARAGPAAAAAARDPSVRDRVARGLEAADRLGMRIVTWDDPAYPSELVRLHDPPPVLFLRGRPELLRAGGVTVVGARKASLRARDIARRLGRALGRSRRTVLSGMALGVDGAAHEGALEVGGDTVAVLGRGADAPYPRVHWDLFRRIAERGLLVSEFMPGVGVQPHHFPRRNRILAVLARAVVVVEAASRSGALITMRHALDMGVDVYAVPGPIDEPACAGSNQALRDGAQALASIERFVEEIAGAEAEGRGDTAPPVTGPGAVVLAALDEGTHEPGELAARAGLPLPRALALLFGLELSGHVEQLPGMRFRRVV